jgi:xanthine dehydrogenase accessory factor
MIKELALWQFIANQLKINEKVMLLVVVNSTGSSPGRQGFKMAINTEGGLCGSIGGGIMEIKLVELAKDFLQKEDNVAFLKKQIHHKNAPHDQSGMICSGEQTILFYTLLKKDLPMVEQIVQSLEKSLPMILKLTPQYFQVFENQTLIHLFYFVSIDETHFVFTENLGFKNELYIIGGGHCALSLSELISKMDFYIHLFDDRSDLNTLEKNKFVHEKHLVDYSEIGNHIPSGNNVYVVVMTVGYRTDALVLRQLLDKKVRYLGVLGSEAKMKTLLQDLENQGFSIDILRGIHTPIGLKINSQTPEEIAVSIAAEIIQVKNLLRG